MTELLILIDGQIIGRISAQQGGRLELAYEQRWSTSTEAHSLSISMPFTQAHHPQKVVSPYLWNLLPENPAVLHRWAQQYHVSEANPFKLLSYVGADVPGAAQFVPAERGEEIQSDRGETVHWMSDAEFAERLQQLGTDAAAMRRPADVGKMSLPGAQAKTAYYYDAQRGRWGVPGGRTPTTHIIKPSIPGFRGLVENEHLCMDIASRLGMPAANSYVLTAQQTYLVVERYDRLPPRPGSAFVERIHQEDVCQALGLMPARKYQEDGGPGIAQIVALIRRVSAEPELDVDRFLQANIFNWLIGGTDAHAKNYSFLISAGDEVRLAPLYDLSSQLPYPDLVAQRVSMKIGDHYEISRINVADWRKLAHNCGLEEERILGMIRDLGGALPDHISAARRQAVSDGLQQKVVASLAKLLTSHVSERTANIG